MEATKKEYHISCKVRVVGQNWRHYKGKTIEDKAVVLIPNQSTEAQKFLNAWLPEDHSEHFEIVGEIAHPVYSACRMSIHRANKLVPDTHHLYMMSVAGVDALVHKDGENIDIKILPEDQDERADEVKY